MQRIIGLIQQIFDEPKKFYPEVDEQGFANRQLKFLPVTEIEYLLEQRSKGIYGNGMCAESDF